MILYKQYQKGFVLVNHGNPAAQTFSYAWLFNALFFAMSKDLLVDSTVGFGDGLKKKKNSIW